MNPDSLQRYLSEPCTFALLQWPALVALLAIDGVGWPSLALRIVLGLLLAVLLLAAYGGGRGVGFGNSMLLQCSLVAAAWCTHPSAWAYAWLAALPLAMLAAQLLRLKAAGAGAGRSDAESFQIRTGTA